ncbi:DNA topoisomerase IV subunit A [Aciduricibacillus chroicocephali]|uniref:DNA topoisomerase 4 subunit A n=1 Tax=Aciduricibacillus chroicocephali TaxID=3054939 RepID=A0ABY9KZQ2_9BACI|nr:DNA topoisomerase IV subunit A [Bacillaceae bacterium 44XB]
MAKTEKYLDLPLEEVIGDRFGRYSKYIIQDRALPDVRDGLKPVQRRILYAMHAEKNTHEKNFRKAAKTVGTVIGNYHPHGDTSVYEAMVRMSQEWKMRHILVEMHGNNGSIDGDPPAAMRYTEGRLSSIASELLKDIEKETVEFVPNFDDTTAEPTVLPAKFPNLLANGSTGISAGYATDIPPHNLGEVIDAVIRKIDKPNLPTDELLNIIKGPDFPTGGIVQGRAGLKKAYETGKGKVVVRSKALVEKLRNGREQIVVEELPYDVNKANLVKKMDELRADKKVEGILEVRDETDRTGLRIVIELKKDANSDGILKYLYKNTDLQIAYHYNMVAIQDKTPSLLSLSSIIEAYIAHQKEVVTRQTRFDLNRAETRAHIVEGLIKAISILDELIALIRASKDKQDAKNSIMKTFGFTERQAEAIVTLQLYRLTNTDITALEGEAEELREQIAKLKAILDSEKKLLSTIKSELRQLKKQYATPRKTVIEDEIEELDFNIDVTVASEDVIVSVTRDGYMKRTSLRSYGASNGEEPAMKEQDHLIGLSEINTTDNVLVFTNKGKYISLPVHAMPEIRWKDIGQHISNIATVDSDEHIVRIIPIRNFKESKYLVFLTKNGMIKRSELNLYEAQRYTRMLIALNLKKEDELLDVFLTKGEQDIFIASNKGYGLRFKESDIPVIGQRAAGVKSMALQAGEHIVGGGTVAHKAKGSLLTVTKRGAQKKMKPEELKMAERAQRGQIMFRELKTKQDKLIGFFITEVEKTDIFVEAENGQTAIIHPEELPFSERTSNGSFIFHTKDKAAAVRTHKIIACSKPFAQKSNN